MSTEQTRNMNNLANRSVCKVSHVTRDVVQLVDGFWARELKSIELSDG